MAAEDELDEHYFEAFFDAKAERIEARKMKDEAKRKTAHRKMWEAIVHLLHNNGDRVSDVLLPRDMANEIEGIGILLLTNNMPEEIEDLLHQGTVTYPPVLKEAQRIAVTYSHYLKACGRKDYNKVVSDAYQINDDTLRHWINDYPDSTWESYRSSEPDDSRVTRLERRFKSDADLYCRFGRSEAAIRKRGRKRKNQPPN